jgi:hypothetical protein
MTPRPNTLCPACGFDLGFPPWQGESPSDEICPCCGIQFGYSDAAGGDIAKRTALYRQWRERWKKSGMKWAHPSDPPPDNWNPEEQLASLMAMERTRR